MLKSQDALGHFQCRCFSHMYKLKGGWETRKGLFCEIKVESSSQACSGSLLHVCSGLPSRQHLAISPSSLCAVIWAEGGRGSHVTFLCVWYIDITPGYSQGLGTWWVLRDYGRMESFRDHVFCVKYSMVWQQDKRLEIRAAKLGTVHREHWK